MDYTEHASKKYVDERNALLATKTALNAEAEERVRLANIVAQNRRDTYSKEEVNRIVDALRGARFEKVQALPELADADTRTIYLLPRATPEAGNSYDEWIVLVDGEGARSWERIGSTDIDLSGYATKEELGDVRDFAQEVSDRVGEMGGSTVADRLADIENCDAEPTEGSEKFVTSGGVFAALREKQSAVARELFLNVQADVWLSAECGDDANDGLAPDRAVKSIARAYAAAKAAVDAQTLDGSRQVVVAVDEGVYAAAMIANDLAHGIRYSAVGDRERTLVMPKGGTYGPGGSYETAMACVNGEHTRVFEMEGFTFTGFNGNHHGEIAQYQSGIVYGMTLRRCLITGNSPICTKAFVCGTFIDCDITGNTTRPNGNAGGDAPFGGYAAVYDDRERYQTRMYGCHVWDNDFSTFQFFAGKIEAKQCLFENSFAAVKSINGEHNTMIADRYTNPLIPPSPSYKKFFAMGSKYFAVIASSADCTTDPFYVETDGYVCVQSAELTEDKVAADASCPSVRSDGSPDFGYRDSGFGRKKTAAKLVDGLRDKLDLAVYDFLPETWEVSNVLYSGGTYTWDDASCQWLGVSGQRAIRAKAGAPNTYQFVIDPGASGETTVCEWQGTAAQAVPFEYGGVSYTVTVEGRGNAGLKPTGDTLAKKSESVPNSRTVNGQPLSSDVTLTGEDIAVSGSDPTKINAALAGKATKSDATLNERGYTAWELSEYTAPGAEGPIVIRASGSGWYPCCLRVGGLSKSIDSSSTSVTWAASEWDGDYPITAERANAASAWAIVTPQALQDGYEVDSDSRPNYLIPVHPGSYGNVKGNAQSTSLTWAGAGPDKAWAGTTDLVATRTALSGYQLGTQSDKPLATEAEAEALRQGKQDKLSAQQLANIAAVPDKLDKSRRVFFATSETAANQSAKTATVDGDGFSLYDGCIVVVESTNGNAQPTPTIDINGTGAKPIRRFWGQDYPSVGQWGSGELLPLMYDGSGWTMLRPARASTGTPGVVQLTAALDAAGMGDTSAPTPNAVKAGLDLKQDRLSNGQLANIDAVPDKRGKLDLNVYEEVPAGWAFTALPEGSVNPYSSLFPEWDGSSGRWMLYEGGTLVGASGASTQEATDIVFLLMNYPQIQIRAVYSEGGTTQTGDALALTSQVVKTPVYDGQNHAFLSATDLVQGEDFVTKGLHRWTCPRKGIVYMRLISGTNSVTVRIGVNVAAGAEDVDDAHCVTALSKFRNETSIVVPLFLNAGDEVCLAISTNPLQYVLFTCFYTD